MSMRRQTRLSAAVAMVIATMTASVPAQTPDAATTSAIAEEALIYGFPLVVNYLHAYFIDPSSGSYKAPFNVIHSEARVYTPQDTAVSTPRTAPGFGGRVILPDHTGLHRSAGDAGSHFTMTPRHGSTSMRRLKSSISATRLFCLMEDFSRLWVSPLEGAAIREDARWRQG